ncbi:MAG: FecR domain-containing protein, partial [Haloferula sp.]
MIPPDLHSQMLRMLDGELSAGELAALEAELEVNPEARRLWQKLSRIHSALEVHYTSKAKVAQSPVVPIDLVLARQRRRVVKNSLLAAAALILISAIGLWLVMAPAAPAGFADFRAASQSVFTLTHAGEGQSPMGHALAEGSRLVLDHGVVELDLPHQVRGIIEAPAVIEMVDDKNLKLDHGRAFFHVGSEAGRGFTVVTPHQRIVDLGTRFGIDATRGRDEVELHVFEGTVRVDALDGGQGETINATRSVVLAGREVSRELEGAPAAFRRQLPEKVETLLHEDFESGLLAGRDYAVRMDPTAIRDLDGNRFPGIDDDKTWNFATLSSPAAIRIPNPGFE